MHSHVMAENVIRISEAEGASDFASLVARLRGRCGGRVQAALERHLQDVVDVPYNRELSREYGKAKASLPPGRIVTVSDLQIAPGAMRHCSPLLAHNRKRFEAIPRRKVVCAEDHACGMASHRAPDS
jgi:predicted nucleic acid-binding protein